MRLTKPMLLKHIEDNRAELITLCSHVIQTPSDNPPGDTSALASLITDYLSEAGLETHRYEPKPGIVTLASTIGEGDPHLVLNGHLDQFPAEVGEPWTVPPYSGKLQDGRIYGRGAGDMKGGLASLLFVFRLMADQGLPGRLTFTGTSDEETGGKWGAKWLLENHPEYTGDAVLNGEPSGLTVRIGEKGKLTVRLTSSGKAAHGSFAGYVGENAVMKMVKVLPRVTELQGYPAKLTPETKRVTDMAMKGYVQQYGHESQEMAEVLRLTTVNVGTINGGAKDNIVPASCTSEVDIRVPLGVTPDEVLAEIRRRVEPHAEATWGRDSETITPATYTSDTSRVAQIVAQNSTEVTGSPPLYSFTSGATDCRYWRLRGVPAVSYGPRVYGMGGVDESILVDDLVKVAKVHACTVLDYFLA